MFGGGGGGVARRARLCSSVGAKTYAALVKCIMQVSTCT